MGADKMIEPMGRSRQGDWVRQGNKRVIICALQQLHHIPRPPPTTAHPEPQPAARHHVRLDPRLQRGGVGQQRLHGGGAVPGLAVARKVLLERLRGLFVWGGQRGGGRG